MAVILAAEDRRRQIHEQSGQHVQRSAREWSRRLHALRDTVLTLSRQDLALPIDQDGSIAAAAETVSILARTCAQTQLALRPGREIERSRALAAAILGLQELATELLLAEMAQRTERMADCSAALHRLRAVPTTAELTDRLCIDAARSCGFSRVVLSRVKDRHWAPWKAYFDGQDPHVSWFAEWVGREIPLDGDAPERRIVARGTPTIVYDTDREPVYRPIIVESGHSRAYVVSTLTVGGDVIGLLHADHFATSDNVETVDRDLLWAFSVGVGYILERTQLVQRMHEQRERIRELLEDAASRLDDLCESSLRIAGPVREVPDGSPGTAAPSPANHEGLTHRERDVLALMARGATNTDIADALVIAEGTVKSHVKHILRKLGVRNRAQAIAWALDRGN